MHMTIYHKNIDTFFVRVKQQSATSSLNSTSQKEDVPKYEEKKIGIFNFQKRILLSSVT